MYVTEALKNEHVIILDFLSILSDAAKKIPDNQGPSKEFFTKALNFSRDFADKYHHYKEEYVMFGLLAQKGNGAIDAQIERHRSQHEHCRNLINEMAKSLDGYEKKLDSPSRTLHRNLTEYIQTLRSHIRSENEVFFPMVEKDLSENEQQNLIKAFAKYEAKVGENVLQTNTKLVQELKKQLSFN